MLICHYGMNTQIQTLILVFNGKSRPVHTGSETHWVTSCIRRHPGAGSVGTRDCTASNQDSRIRRGARNGRRCGCLVWQKRVSDGGKWNPQGQAPFAASDAPTSCRSPTGSVGRKRGHRWCTGSASAEDAVSRYAQLFVRQNHRRLLSIWEAVRARIAMRVRTTSAVVGRPARW